MSLCVVSTPIGNYKDITLRAIETLQKADIIICEELKPCEILLKKLNIADKKIHLLNEHSQSKDIKELLKLCQSHQVALVSDCGTPGFADPGAELVELCYKENILVDANPGPSSLMTLISLSGIKLNEFYFVGFLPAENALRQQQIQALLQYKVPLIFMDTPYRLNKTLQELSLVFGSKNAVLGYDLTTKDQKIIRGKLKDIASKDYPKAPFILILF